MNENEKIKLTLMLTELFLSKIKKPSNEVLQVFIKHLSIYEIQKVYIAINEEIHSEDDFITLGKIIRHLEKKLDHLGQASEMFQSIINCACGYDFAPIPETAKELVKARWGSVKAITHCRDEFRLAEIKREFVKAYSEIIKTETFEKKLLGVENKKEIE